MMPTAGVELVSVPVAIGGASAQIDIPVGWLVDPEPPVVVMPPSWDGEPPGVVISVEHDDLQGDALAATVAHAALTRLGDPVIVSLTQHRGSATHRRAAAPALPGRDTRDHVADDSDDAVEDGHATITGTASTSTASGTTDAEPRRPDVHAGDDIEIVVAHEHRGVDVTTVERHQCRPGPVRWVVGFTVAHPDVPRLMPLARHVVASLRTTS